MFSINLKRSVMTLAVVAGLLAAAAPASAQHSDGQSHEPARTITAPGNGLFGPSSGSVGF